MKRRHHEDAHGMSDREVTIMNLNDAGLPARAIAEQLGIGSDYVRITIGRYHFGKLGQEMSAAEAAVRHADALFQRALLASGGRFA